MGKFKEIIWIKIYAIVANEPSRASGYSEIQCPALLAAANGKSPIAGIAASRLMEDFLPPAGLVTGIFAPNAELTNQTALERFRQTPKPVPIIKILLLN